MQHKNLKHSNSSRAISTSTTFCCVQVTDFFKISQENALAYELSNPVTSGYFIFIISEIEKKYAYITTVVLINYTSPNINTMFNRKTTTRSDSTIATIRKSNL